MNSLSLFLLLVVLSSIAVPLNAQVSGAYGCDSSWVLYPNTNIYGGVLQPNVTTEDDCRAACYSNGTCQGVDFNPSNGQGQQCFLQFVTAPKSQVNGIDHWDYNRTALCAGLCGRWTANNNTGFYGGTVQPSATNEDQCKSACLRNSTCSGVDWNSQNPTGQQCFLLINKAGVYYASGVTHWDYNSTAGCQSACGSWTPFSNTGVAFGIEQPSVRSEDDCKTTCMGISACTGIDWNPGNDPGYRCFVHFDYGTKNSWTGITHWDFNRTGVCSVDCLNAFTAFPNTGVAGGIQQPNVSTDVDCKKACISNSSCVALDWNPSNGPGQQCYLLSTSGPRNGWAGIYHYEFNRSSCSVDCLYAFVAFPDMGVAGGIEQPTAMTSDNCKKACINDDSCVALDWNPSNDPGHQCYILYATGPKNNWTGIYHYDFNRTTCSANQVKNCWTKTSDTHAYSGMPVPTATDIASCQDACRNLNSCSSIDWDRTQTTDNACYIFPNSQPTAPSPGVDHYVYSC